MSSGTWIWMTGLPSPSFTSETAPLCNVIPGLTIWLTILSGSIRNMLLSSVENLLGSFPLANEVLSSGPFSLGSIFVGADTTISSCLWGALAFFDFDL